MKSLIYSFGIVVAMDRPKLWLDDKLHIRLKSLDTIQKRPKVEEATAPAKALYIDDEVSSASVPAARRSTTILAMDTLANTTSDTTTSTTNTTTNTTTTTTTTTGSQLGAMTYNPISPATNGTGSDYQWFVTEFTECSVFCGNGTQQRNVECRDSTGLVSLDSICNATFPKPDSVIDCQGPCISCPDLNGDFFLRSGLGDPASPAMWGSNLTQLSFCPASNLSCCTFENEQMIKSQAALASKALDDVLLNSPTTKDKATSALAKYIALIEERQAENSAALATVEGLIASEASDKLTVLPILKQALTQRSTDLAASITIMQTAMKYVEEQISSYSSQLSGSDEFAQCTQAALSLNAQVACASCSPTFTSTYVNQTSSTVLVSLDDCQLVYQSCQPVIATGHSQLVSALEEMDKVHASLKLVASKLQVALSRVWSTLQFDWVPGDTTPADINSNPDMTMLKCIKSTVSFSLPEISEPADFCGMYFSPLAANTFSSRLELTLMQGVKSLTDLSNCDGCIHGVLIRLTNVISQGSAALDISLPLGSEKAQGGNPCLMATQTPQSMLLLTQMTKARSFSKLGHKLKEEEESGTYPLTVGFVSSGGVQASVAGNFSNYSDLIDITNILPPQSQWKIRSDNAPALQIWDLACSDHTDCYDALNNKNADAPWWFCASKTACDGATCGENDLALLQKGPRCAMGQCANATQAIDGVCPDYAVCPSSTYEPFAGPTYFYKFQSLTSQKPGESGVCDCAFTGTVSLDAVAKKETVSVSDICAQAACAAYALQYESSSSCNQQLSALCLAAQKSGCSVECDPTEAQFNPPSCDSNQVGALFAEVRSSATSSSIGLAVVICLLMLWS